MSKGAKRMFQRILVPLDGSSRAEQAITVAANVARASGGSVVLLRVVTSPADLSRYGLESAHALQEAVDADIERATQYLAEIAAWEALAGISVTTEVLPGDPSLTIFPVAHAHQADLIIICSHGSTGVRRWGMGSVSQKVARHSPLPVLILREGAGVPTNLHPEGVRSVRILVSLDGSPLAETAILPAAYLSTGLSAPAPGALHLARVLPFPADETKPQNEQANEQAAEAKEKALAEADSYLQNVKQRLLTEDIADLKLQITTAVGMDTDVADVLIGMAEDGEGMEEVEGFEGCDIIAMATHGRGGLQRWVMGSMTERVLSSTKLPLLIIRPQKIEARNEKTVVTTTESSTSWVGLL